MGKQPTKAVENIYFKARKEAAKYNDKLYSREGAAELLGVSVSSLADYELNLCKVVPVDKVVSMADLYNAPELKNSYCAQECPIGRDKIYATEVKAIELVTIKMMQVFNNSEIEKIKNDLLEISSDGIISNDEIPTMQSILERLDKIIEAANELKLIGEKTLAANA